MTFYDLLGVRGDASDIDLKVSSDAPFYQFLFLSHVTIL